MTPILSLALILSLTWTLTRSTATTCWRVTRSTRRCGARCNARCAPSARRSTASRRRSCRPRTQTGRPVVPPPPFKALPRLQPVAGAQLHLQPISSLLAGRHALLTACVGGQVQTWARPEPNPHPDPNPTATRHPPPAPTPKSPLQVKTWARPSEHDARCPAGRAPLANGGKAP